MAFATYPEDRERAVTRRALLKAAKKCINASVNNDGPGQFGVLHGPLVANSRGQLGVRCEYCVLVHKLGKEPADVRWLEIQTGPEPRPFGPLEMIPTALMPERTSSSETT